VFRGDKEQFQFKFKGSNIDEESVEETWETTRCLSDVRADWITGSATRIWEIKRVLDTETHRLGDGSKVLKEIWMQDSRVTEGVRYREIRDWFKSHPERAHLAQHFFTFYAEGVVEVNGTKDSTFVRLRGGLAPKERSDRDVYEVAPAEVVSHNVLSGSQGPVPELARTKKQHFARPSVDRKHVRLLVDEVAKPIDQLETFGEVFDAIIGGNRGKW
jgi:hypothetical protein